MSGAWRRLLLPLVPIYASVVRFKRWLYDLGFLDQRHLGHPVLSVGSLSTGGAGKTPVVLMLAELLDRRGFEVRILTRGYGRTGKLTAKVDPEGDSKAYGDEPLMLARRLPDGKVFVGSDRYRAGMLAEVNDGPRTKAVYLLDDGFQHQKLARDLEILLITRQDLEDRLLPAGNLREPLRAATRPDFIFLREDEVDVAKLLEIRLGYELPPMLRIRRRLRLPNKTAIPVRPFIFTGLARPDGFTVMLKELGITPQATHFFRDHHPYSGQDMDVLIVEAGKVHANGFVTTEKDAVKLTSAMMDRLQMIGPVVVASLDVELLDEASAIDAVVARLQTRST